MPPEAGVESKITADALTRQAIDIPPDQVEFQMPREGHERPQRELVVRTRALCRAHGRGVHTVLISAQIELEIGVDATHAPPAERLPIGGQFDPITLAVELIAEKEG
jgi:hypothetical protein